MSLVKTRLRASRRGEIPSPVGVRQPNPYENVRIFLEFAIYQTHVKYSMNDIFIKIGDAAKILGVNPQTLREDHFTGSLIE